MLVTVTIAFIACIISIATLASIIIHSKNKEYKRLENTYYEQKETQHEKETDAAPSYDEEITFYVEEDNASLRTFNNTFNTYPALKERFEQVLTAYSNAYTKNGINVVKTRFLLEDADREHNQILTAADKEKEYDLLEREALRFLFLSTIFKEVPMYSEHVDEVWHIMLLFTENYQQFSYELLGESNLIHHAPNIDYTPAPKVRAYFDFLYTAFFGVSKYAQNKYGRFYRMVLDKGIIADFSGEPTSLIYAHYFRPNLSPLLMENTYNLLKDTVKPIGTLKKKTQSVEESYTHLQTSVKSGQLKNNSNASEFFDAFYAFLDVSHASESDNDVYTYSAYPDSIFTFFEDSIINAYDPDTVSANSYYAYTPPTTSSSYSSDTTVSSDSGNSYSSGSSSCGSSCSSSSCSSSSCGSSCGSS